jgi:hypothetical protein
MTIYALVLISTFTFQHIGENHVGTDKTVTVAEFKNLADCNAAQNIVQKGAVLNTYLACVPVTTDKK